MLDYVSPQLCDFAFLTIKVQTEAEKQKIWTKIFKNLKQEMTWHLFSANSCKYMKKCCNICAFDNKNSEISLFLCLNAADSS